MAEAVDAGAMPVRARRAQRMRAALDPVAVRRSRGEWASDSVLVALALLVWFYYGIAIPGYFTAIPDWFWSVDLSLGLLACLSLWWARRYPVAVAIWLLLPGTLAVTAGFAVLIGIYRLGTRARPRVSALVTIAHILLALPYHSLFPLPGMGWLVWFIVIPLLYLLVLSFGLLARSRRQVIDGLRDAAARDRERHAHELAELRRDERERIAREMHDVLAHRISLLSVHAGALEYRTAADRGERNPPSEAEVHAAAVVIRDNAHLAIEDLRQVLSVLRDETDQHSALGNARPQPRLDDVAGLVEEARRAGQQVELRLELPETAAVRESVQRTVYRLVQEGLTNARKHAPHALVTVDVRAVGDGIRAVVANPVRIGLTASDIPGAGTGLAGLVERVRLDGGRVEHGVSGGVFQLVGELPGGGA